MRRRAIFWLFVYRATSEHVAAVNVIFVKANMCPTIVRSVSRENCFVKYYSHTKVGTRQRFVNRVSTGTT